MALLALSSSSPALIARAFDPSASIILSPVDQEFTLSDFSNSRKRKRHENNVVPSSRIDLPTQPPVDTDTGSAQQVKWNIVHLAFSGSQLLAVSLTATDQAPSLRITVWGLTPEIKVIHDVFVSLTICSRLLSFRVISDKGPECVAVLDSGQVVYVRLFPHNLLPKRENRILVGQIPPVENASEWRSVLAAISGPAGGSRLPYYTDSPLKILIAHQSIQIPSHSGIPIQPVADSTDLTGAPFPALPESVLAEVGVDIEGTGNVQSSLPLVLDTVPTSLPDTGVGVGLFAESDTDPTSLFSLTALQSDNPQNVSPTYDDNLFGAFDLGETTLEELERGFGGVDDASGGIGTGGVGVMGVGGVMGATRGPDSKRLLHRAQSEERLEILVLSVIDGKLRLHPVKGLNGVGIGVVDYLHWISENKLFILERESESDVDTMAKVFLIEKSAKSLSNSFTNLFPEKKALNLSMEWSATLARESTLFGVRPTTIEVAERLAAIISNISGSTKLSTVDLETLRLVGEKIIVTDERIRGITFSPDRMLVFLPTRTHVLVHTLFDMTPQSVPQDIHAQCRTIGASLASSILANQTITPLIMPLAGLSIEFIMIILKNTYFTVQSRLGGRLLERSPVTMHLLGLQAELYKHKSPIRSALCLDILSLCFIDLAMSKYYLIPVRNTESKEKKKELSKASSNFQPDCIWPVVGHQIWFMELMRRILENTLLGEGKQKIAYSDYENPGDHFLLLHPLPRALITRLIYHFASFDGFLMKHHQSSPTAASDGGDVAKHVLADHSHAIGLHLPSLLEHLKQHLSPTVDAAWKESFNDNASAQQLESLQTLVTPAPVCNKALKEAISKLSGSHVMWESPFNPSANGRSIHKDKFKIDVFTKAKIISKEAPLSMCKRCGGLVEEIYASRWMRLEWSKKCFCGGDRWKIGVKE